MGGVRSDAYIYMGISFDKAGNRTSQTTYNYTIGTPGNETATESYNYTGDRLTQVGSTVYQYGAIGNPTTYNGYTLEWNGRKLMEMSMNGDSSCIPSRITPMASEPSRQTAVRSTTTR